MLLAVPALEQPLRPVRQQGFDVRWLGICLGYACFWATYT